MERAKKTMKAPPKAVKESSAPNNSPFNLFIFFLPPVKRRDALYHMKNGFCQHLNKGRVTEVPQRRGMKKSTPW